MTPRDPFPSSSDTSALHADVVDEAHAAKLRESGRAEVRAWEKSLPKAGPDSPDTPTSASTHPPLTLYPPLDALNGLPDGWTVLALFQPEDTDWWTRMGYHIQNAILRSPLGGWSAACRIVTDPDVASARPGSSILNCYATPVLLYTELAARIQSGSNSNPSVWDKAYRHLRGMILNAYDPNDPIEAAERTLLALGGAISHTPAALR